jgi:uncharacterized protein with ParB-like and HNH nuclease domain
MITRLPPKETIWRVIKDIEKGYFKLPNIQRYFVWDEDKILQLLDSIFKGYPFGSMLLWKPNEELKIKARDFIKDFKEGMRLLSHIQDNNDFYLVLDGQQRLQSLYILLMGLYNDKKVYFKLDAKDDEDKFYLKEPEKVANEMFIRPSKLLDLTPKDKHKFIEDLGINGDMKSVVEGNIDVFREQFVIQELIHFLPPVDEDTNIDDVVEIFIRVNSGGMVLSPSDLIFSTLVSKVSEFEEKFTSLLEFMNDNDRFSFDISFLIKSSLVIFNKGAKYNIRKLKDDEYITKLKDNFEGFEESIKATIDFLRNRMKIRNDRFLKSKIALIPIIDWAYKQPNYQIKETEECKLKQYLYLVSSNRFFSYGTDSKLDDIHGIIKHRGTVYFPWDEIVNDLDNWGYETALPSDDLLFRKRDLVLNILEDGIEQIDSRRGWSIESDHIFPRSTLESLVISEDLINDIGNLRFLNKARNISKSNKIPERDLDFFGKTSLEEIYYSSIGYLEKGDTKNFRNAYLRFTEERKKLIVSKLRGFLCL